MRALWSGQDVATVGEGARLVMAAVRNLVWLASRARMILPTSDTAFALKESPVDTDMSTRVIPRSNRPFASTKNANH